MPLIQIFPSVPVPEERVSPLLVALSSTLAKHFKKPESYVMTRLAPSAPMTFGGTDEPTCYAEVKNVGKMTSAQSADLSAALTAEIGRALGVSAKRTYIEFADAEPHLWGYDGATFG